MRAARGGPGVFAGGLETPAPTATAAAEGSRRGVDARGRKDPPVNRKRRSVGGGDGPGFVAATPARAMRGGGAAARASVVAETPTEARRRGAPTPTGRGGVGVVAETPGVVAETPAPERGGGRAGGGSRGALALAAAARKGAGGGRGKGGGMASFGAMVREGREAAEREFAPPAKRLRR